MFEVDHNWFTIGHRIFLLNAKRVFVSHDAKHEMPALIVLAMEDVTKQRRVEVQLANYAKELEAKVAERTKDLEDRVRELEEITKAFVGRELRVRELKAELAKMRRQEKKRGANGAQ